MVPLAVVDTSTAMAAVFASFVAGAGVAAFLRGVRHADEERAPATVTAKATPASGDLAAPAAGPGDVMQRQTRRILDSLVEGVLGVDERGRTIFLNPAASALLGWGPRDLMGVSLHHLVMHSDADGRDVSFEEGLLRRALEDGETVEHPDAVFWSKDRAPVRVACSVAPMKEAGRTTGAVVVLRDISEQRRAEQRFRQLLDAAPDAMVIADESGTIVHANQRVAEVLGYDPAGLVGRPVEDLVPEALRERHVAHREGYVQNPAPRPMGADLDLHARRADGSLIPVEISLGPIRTPEGILVTAAIRDVRDHRETERRLRASEVHLNQAQQIAHLGSWDYDPASGQVDWSDELYRIYGLEPGSVEVDLERLMEAVHEDDRGLIQQVVEDAGATGEPFRFLHRLVRPDGAVRVVEGRGRVVMKDGTAVRMHGTALDVTDRPEGQALLSGKDKARRLRPE